MAHIKISSRLLIALILFLSWLATPAAADSPQTDQAQASKSFIYTVQPGDTLLLIAQRYHLTLADIILANDLQNPNFIMPGQHLILPDVTPPPAPAPVSSLGDHIHTIQPGETLTHIAGVYHISVDELIRLNQLSPPYLLHIGQLLRVPFIPPPPVQPLDYLFANVSLSEPTISQGRTLVVRITLAEPATVSGTFAEQPLFFYESGPQQFWSLVPIHALLEPKSYPLNLAAALPDGRTATKVEYIQVNEGPYGSERIWLDQTTTALLEPELVRLELEKVMNIWSQVSPRPRWEGPFWYPVGGDSPRFTSYFGTRRYYNNSSDLGFHGGVDFGGGVGTPIYAPAAGVVALAEQLTVRGNAVLIDHGLGLYSGYWHMSEIVVIPGQEVRRGDLIGYIGATGLVTGPHLHWELRLNGIAVNPLQWVRGTIP